MKEINHGKSNYDAASSTQRASAVQEREADEPAFSQLRGSSSLFADGGFRFDRLAAPAGWLVLGESGHGLRIT